MASVRLVSDESLVELLCRHREVCEAAAAIAIEKMALRCSNNLIEQGELGVANRIFLDKGSRVLAKVRHGEHADVDDILDSINYLVFLLFLGEEGSGPLGACLDNRNVGP